MAAWRLNRPLAVAVDVNEATFPAISRDEDVVHVIEVKSLPEKQEVTKDDIARNRRSPSLMAQADYALCHKGDV